MTSTTNQTDFETIFAKVRSRHSKLPLLPNESLRQQITNSLDTEFNNILKEFQIEEGNEAQGKYHCIVDKNHGKLKIFRRSTKDSPLKLGMGYTTLENVDMNTLFNLIYSYGFLKQRNVLVDEAKDMYRIDDTTVLSYTFCKSPVPLLLADREFWTFTSYRVIPETNSILMIAKSLHEIEESILREGRSNKQRDYSKVVIGDLHIGGIHLLPQANNNLKVEAVIRLDPKGSIPTLVVNSILKETISLTVLPKLVEKYRKWIQQDHHLQWLEIQQSTMAPSKEAQA